MKDFNNFAFLKYGPVIEQVVRSVVPLNARVFVDTVKILRFEGMFAIFPSKCNAKNLPAPPWD